MTLGLLLLSFFDFVFDFEIGSKDDFFLLFDLLL
jgi:hypothetical protein